MTVEDTKKEQNVSMSWKDLAQRGYVTYKFISIDQILPPKTMFSCT